MTFGMGKVSTLEAKQVELQKFWRFVVIEEWSKSQICEFVCLKISYYDRGGFSPGIDPLE